MKNALRIGLGSASAKRPEGIKGFRMHKALSSRGNMQISLASYTKATIPGHPRRRWSAQIRALQFREKSTTYEQRTGSYPVSCLSAGVFAAAAGSGTVQKSEIR